MSIQQPVLPLASNSENQVNKRHIPACRTLSCSITTLCWFWRLFVTEQGADEADTAVMFHRDNRPPEEAGILSLAQAAALGYRILRRGSLLALRTPYSSPFSYFTTVLRDDDVYLGLGSFSGCWVYVFLQEKGLDLEIVRATILYRLGNNFLAVDIAVACALSLCGSSVFHHSATGEKYQREMFSLLSTFSPPGDATADGADLLWTVPYILSPLVRGQFRDRGLGIGVNGQTLTQSESKRRGFKISLLEGRAEIRIPVGASGGHIKVPPWGTVPNMFIWLIVKLFLKYLHKSVKNSGCWNITLQNLAI